MRLLAALLLAVVVSGCTAPIQATRDLPQPQSLAEVNALLDGKRVTVDFVGGGQMPDIYSASVTPDRLLYASSRRDAPRETVDMGRVQRLTYVRNRGTAWGSRIGAIPGLLLVGASGLLIFDDLTTDRCGADCDFDTNGLGVIFGAIGVGFGAAVAGVGAGIGGAVGQGVSPGGVVPLYEAPLDQYLGVEAAEPSR